MHQTLVGVGHVSLVADVVHVMVWFLFGHQMLHPEDRRRSSTGDVFLCAAAALNVEPRRLRLQAQRKNKTNNMFLLVPCAFADVHSFRFPRAFDYRRSVGFPCPFISLNSRHQMDPRTFRVLLDLPRSP